MHMYVCKVRFTENLLLSVITARLLLLAFSGIVVLEKYTHTCWRSPPGSRHSEKNDYKTALRQAIQMGSVFFDEFSCTDFPVAHVAICCLEEGLCAHRAPGSIGVADVSEVVPPADHCIWL